ncbi:MAG: ExbD/TolR family protein [Acidobacteriota bacterium]
MGFSLSGQDEDDAVLADINVTPMVDVMLVLLIIFMVTAPMLHPGIQVDLPEAASAETMKMAIDDPLVLSIKADGLVYVRDEPVHPSQLVERLLPILSRRDDRQVFLKADTALPYGQFIAVVDALHQGDIREIGLVTEPVDRATRRGRR